MNFARKNQQWKKYLPWSRRLKILIGGYSQNIGSLYAGDEKLGCPHCFSPVNLTMFGLVDASLLSNKLNAFACTEDDSAKGRRFLLSCALAYLDNLESHTHLPNNQDLTTEVAPHDDSAIALEFNMICDNCMHQKNNNNMLRGRLMIALIHHFRTENVLFLAKVHPKNACDRTLNLTKQHYHK